MFAAATSLDLSLSPNRVVLVSLSTTLATNTLTEGYRGKVCLLLVGYDGRCSNSLASSVSWPLTSGLRPRGARPHRKRKCAA